MGNTDAREWIKGLFVSVPWRVLDRYLDVVQHLGLNIEIGFDGSDLDGVTRSQLRSTAAVIRGKGTGVTLHGPFWDLNLGSVDLAVRQVSRFRLHQFADIFSVFEPIQVVCHTGYDPRHHRFQRDSWLERSVEAWGPLVDRAERQGLSILLENVWEHGPELHRDLIEQVGSRHFGFCLDVGHQHSFSKTALPRWLEVLGDHLREIHLHDNDGTGDDHLPVGQGNIDFERLFRFLNARGLKPILTLEPHKEEHLEQSISGLERVLAQMEEGNAP